MTWILHCLSGRWACGFGLRVRDRGEPCLVRAIEIAGEDIVLPFLRTADVFARLLERHPMLASQWPGATPDRPAALPLLGDLGARAG